MFPSSPVADLPTSFREGLTHNVKSPLLLSYRPQRPKLQVGTTTCGATVYSNIPATQEHKPSATQRIVMEIVEKIYIQSLKILIVWIRYLVEFAYREV